MSYSSLVGSLGVMLLLAAFFLNLFRYIQQGGKLYIVLNIIGAGAHPVSAMRLFL